MAGPKFFVHGGSRWREIDTNSGSVSGWGNVEFLSVHHGRLRVARKNSVLRGLRSLAAGKPTSVHDGPPLSQIRLTNAIEDKKEEECTKFHHHCCCRQQDLRYNTDVIFDNLLKAATSTASVQCSLTEVKSIQPSTSKITVLSPKKHTIDYNQNQEKILLAKRKHSTSDNEGNAKRKNISTRAKSDSEDNTQAQTKKTPLFNSNRTKYKKIKSVKSTRKSSSSDEVQILPRLRKSLRLNQENADISEKKLTGPKDRHTLNTNKNDKLRKPARKASTSDDDEPKLKKSPQKNQDVTTSTQSKERSTRNLLKTSTNVTDEKVLKKSKRKLSVSDDEDVRKVSKTGNEYNFGPRQTQDSENELCKELLIGEEDVLLLRTFIEKDEANIFGVDLERFDSDDNYKGMIFYKLNPLVNVVRSKQIAAMLREERSESNTVSFEDFISKLGLRSVLDSSSQSSSKYKMRPRQIKNQTSESELDKENYKKSKRDNSKTSHNKVLVESSRDTEKNSKKNRIISKKVKGLKGKMTSKPQKSRSIEVLSLSSDSDFEKSKQSVQRSVRNKEIVRNKESDSDFEKSKQSAQKSLRNKESVRNKERDSDFEKSKQSVRNKESERNKQANDEQRLMSTVVLKRLNKRDWVVSPGRVEKGGRVEKPGRVSGRSGREYTIAEDEAIVSWVRGAGRARRVNGNQLWRELETIHQQRTGHFRSWHSLRNRYLRYLLPTLGTLALPPYEAARLRADAAAGEIKSRKKPQRYSLPKQPVVQSAWSRRPRSPPPQSSPSPLRSRSRSPLPSSSRSPSPARTRTKSLPVRRSSSSPSYSPTDSETSTMSKDVWRYKVPSVKKSARQLRSSGVSPNKEKEMLSYSQLTRRFADKHSTPSDVTSDRRHNKHSTPNDVTSDRRRDKISTPSDVTSDRRHNKHSNPSDVTSDRHRDKQTDRPRTRRLYNPNAM